MFFGVKVAKCKHLHNKKEQKVVSHVTFCQCSSKLSSILTFFGSSQRVARGGVKRPCKHERAFFLRKTRSQNGQSEKDK
nr:MAG TPA: hypothetical protein [Caudoviricetes sp.]